MNKLINLLWSIVFIVGFSLALNAAGVHKGGVLSVTPDKDQMPMFANSEDPAFEQKAAFKVN